MKNKPLFPKFWLGVACKSHVAIGEKIGICQFCHGKQAPAKRLHRGDFVIYYSSKVDFDRTQTYQKFTAIGTIIDDRPYQIEAEDGFSPWRRNIKYFTEAQHLDIKPLIPFLSFIKNQKYWGYAFKSGFFEIDQNSFELIAKGMLGYIPEK